MQVFPFRVFFSFPPKNSKQKNIEWVTWLDMREEKILKTVLARITYARNDLSMSDRFSGMRTMRKPVEIMTIPASRMPRKVWSNHTESITATESKQIALIIDWLRWCHSYSCKTYSLVLNTSHGTPIQDSLNFPLNSFIPAWSLSKKCAMSTIAPWS